MEACTNVLEVSKILWKHGQRQVLWRKVEILNLPCFLASQVLCFFFFWGLIYLWYLLLWLLKVFLEEKVLSQRSQGIHIPSRWLASMWFLIQVASPSLPHTLQMRDTSCLGVPSNCLPDGIIFWPFSIIDLTFSSSAWRSALIFHSQLLLLLISCLAHLLRVLD